MHASVPNLRRRSLLVAILAAALSGCGGSSGGTDAESEPLDRDDARQLFQTTCRACHSLSDASAAGVYGPDLDLLQPDEERVREQIESGGGGMPDKLLEGDQADLVARYVAEVAGSGPEPAEDGPERRGATKGTPPAATPAG